MAFTSETRSRHWIQIAFLMALGALAAASAAWGQISEPSSPENTVVAPAANQREATQTNRVWPQKLIDEINVDPRDHSEIKPPDKSAVLVGSASPDNWFNATYAYQVFHWTAPNIHYQPLYFEDVALERYGQQRRGGLLDVPRTAILFYGNLLALPYNMCVTPKHSIDSPLGFERPGSPAPATRNYLLYRW